VLSRTSRLTSPADFQTTLRRGRRAGSRSLVVHLVVPAPASRRSADPVDPARPARVGFVVSRAVGGAVVRNQVKRRLRHLSRDLLPQLPSGALLVVRALPAARTASYAELRAELGHGLERVLERGGRPDAPVDDRPDAGVRR
jgi:ribonuclease P protein component